MQFCVQNTIFCPTCLLWHSMGKCQGVCKLSGTTVHLKFFSLYFSDSKWQTETNLDLSAPGCVLLYTKNDKVARILQKMRLQRHAGTPAGRSCDQLLEMARWWAFTKETQLFYILCCLVLVLFSDLFFALFNRGVKVIFRVEKLS